VQGQSAKTPAEKYKLFLKLPAATLHAGFLGCPPWPGTEVTLTGAGRSVKEKDVSCRNYFFKGP
jgi:hypothetical protein